MIELDCVFHPSSHCLPKQRKYSAFRLNEMNEIFESILDCLEDRNQQTSLLEEWNYEIGNDAFDENYLLQKGVLYLMEDNITSKLNEMREIAFESELLQRYSCPHTITKRMSFREEHNLLFFQIY